MYLNGETGNDISVAWLRSSLRIEMVDELLGIRRNGTIQPIPGSKV